MELSSLTDVTAVLGLLGLTLTLGIGIHFGWRFACANQHVNGLIADHLAAESVNDAADRAITADDWT
jgi:hypothetical protein